MKKLLIALMSIAAGPIAKAQMGPYPVHPPDAMGGIAVSLEIASGTAHVKCTPDPDHRCVTVTYGIANVPTAEVYDANGHLWKRFEFDRGERYESKTETTVDFYGVKEL